jgi:hypothetical protein
MALAVMSATLVAAASPAAADTELTAEVGYVDGQIVPGRPVPVRVQIRADELVSGTISVTPFTFREPGDAVTVPVEVAGGSVKDYVVVVPTFWNGAVGPSEFEVTLHDGDDPQTTRATASWTGDVEVVGFLPGVVSQLPDPVPLHSGLGRAVFTQLDDQTLAAPGALGPLGSIVTDPSGLSGLPAEARRHVLEWVEEGGQLLVDAAPGSSVADIPAAWQPTGSRAPAGEGWIRLTDGAAATGQWDRIIEPTRQFGPGEMSMGQVCCFAGVADSVARDAGLRIPEVGWLLVFLIAYVVVIGPVTFVVARRLRRTTLTWVAVPLVAVLFTGVAFTAGSSMRSGAQAAHGSLVQTSPLGDRVVSYLGLVSRDGRDPTAHFPEGWHAGGLDPGMLAGELAFDGSGGAMAGGSDPVAVTDDGRPGVRLPLSAGDYGMVTGQGRIAEDSPLEVTATAAADGSVSGTVVNASDFDLERVIVVVAGETADVGDLPAGAESEWTVDAATGAFGPDRDPWAPVETPWADATGQFDEPDIDSEVNYAVYASQISGDVDAYPPGVAVAAGWTTDWAPPVDVGSDVVGGRTGVVARTVVTAEPGTLPAAAVRREFVRGPGATRFDPAVEIPDWGEAAGGVARFTLPDGTDPATPLVLEAAAGVAQVEVWNGESWLAVDLASVAAADNPAEAGAEAAAGGDPAAGERLVVVDESAGPTIVAQPPPPLGADGPVFGDPFGPPFQVDLPTGAVQDGVVYVRVAMSPEIATRVLLQLRGVS